MITFRKITPADSNLLFAWRNDPDSIAQSLTTSSVTPEEHARWYERKLCDPTALLLICEKDAKPCGHIRFDRIDDQFLISFVVAPEFRGQGLAVDILSGGVKVCNAQHPEIRIFKAQVKLLNVASLKAFNRAGFKQVSKDDSIACYELSV